MTLVNGHQDALSHASDEQSGQYHLGSAVEDGTPNWEKDATKLIEAVQSLSSGKAFEDIRATLSHVGTLRSLVREKEQKLDAVRRESSTQEETHVRSIRDLLATYHTLQKEAEVRESDFESRFARLQGEHEETTANLDNRDKHCAALQDELDEVYNTLQARDDTCASDRELIKSLGADIAERDTQLQNLQESLHASEENREHMRRNIDALRQEISTLTTNSNNLAVNLKRYTDYVYLLKPLSLEDCIAELDVIWEDLRRVIFDKLGEDVPDSTLKTPDAWQRFQRATEVTPEVPIFPSNSPDAKAIRIAAVLGLIARRISVRIFHPSYLFEEDVELRNLLAAETMRNSERERLLRGILTAISDKQEISGGDLVDTVVGDVARAVAPILTSVKEEELNRELRPVLVRALKFWSRVQRGKQKLESSVDPDLLAEHAKPLPLLLEHSQSMARTSADDSHAQDDLVIVFPALFLLDEEDSFRCIYPGYSLKRKQTYAAAEEARNARSGGANGPKSLSSMSRRSSTAQRPQQKSTWASMLTDLL